MIFRLTYFHAAIFILKKDFKNEHLWTSIVNKNDNDTFSSQHYEALSIIPPLHFILRPLISSKLLGFSWPLQFAINVCNNNNNEKYYVYKIGVQKNMQLNFMASFTFFQLLSKMYWILYDPYCTKMIQCNNTSNSYTYHKKTDMAYFI